MYIAVFNVLIWKRQLYRTHGRMQFEKKLQLKPSVDITSPASQGHLLHIFIKFLTFFSWV